MPVSSTGVGGWRLLHPTYDGRGVLIAILDSGVDPGVPGLTTTSTGEPKVLDVRDFSGEGEVRGGVLRELQFGDMPQADLNGDGDNRDEFAVEISRDSAGFRARIDLNGSGTLDDDAWFRDYSIARETFTFSSRFVMPGRGPVTGALNFSSDGTLVVYLDNSSHGTHVAGIAAGFNIYGQRGFHGVAPGAQILGLKIADNLRGAVSTTASMIRALEYAAGEARRRNMPLVINMSFGVGNSQPGRAVMDSIIDAFLIANPGVFFATSAGNDGPGTETMGLPASSELVATIGATYPSTFAGLQFGAEREFPGWWSARGGSTAKPDFVAPGVAYSTVPGWRTGEEVSGGTSMAAPHAAGLAALLFSAARAESLNVNAADILAALRASAMPFEGEAFIDQGAGLPDVRRALARLRAARGAARIRVEAMAPAGVQTVASALRRVMAPGAYRRAGLKTAADTVQRFRISGLPGTDNRGPNVFRLVSDAPWLRVASPTVTIGATGSAVVEVTYDPAALAMPGRYAGVVRGIPANDSAAAPAFVLANTILVPEPEPRVSVTRQTVRGGAARRWYVNVPENAAGLIVRASIAHPRAKATLALYEPSGRPARHAKSPDLNEDTTSTVVVVDPADAVAGVWEIVLQAMPGPDVPFDLSVELAPGEGTVTEQEWVGADTSFSVTLDNGAWQRRFAVPAWARKMVAEIAVTPELWNHLTDFAVTMFDTAGVRFGNGAMNYPTHRVTATLPEARVAGFGAVLDLFPAWALHVPPGAQAQVRLRFEGAPAPSPQAAPLGWGSVRRDRWWLGNDKAAATTRLTSQ